MTPKPSPPALQTPAADETDSPTPLKRARSPLPIPLRRSVKFKPASNQSDWEERGVSTDGYDSRDQMEHYSSVERPLPRVSEARMSL